MRRAELERLYQLSRAMLMDDETDLNRSTLTPVRDIFHLTQVASYDAELGQTYPEDPTPLKTDRLEQSARLNEDAADGNAVY